MIFIVATVLLSLVNMVFSFHTHNTSAGLGWLVAFLGWRLVKWLVEQEERGIDLTHKFQMNGHGTPDRPCVKCGLPDRDEIHKVI